MANPNPANKMSIQMDGKQREPIHRINVGSHEMVFRPLGARPQKKENSYDAYEWHIFEQSEQLRQHLNVGAKSLYNGRQMDAMFDLRDEIRPQFIKLDAALLKSRWHKVIKRMRGAEHITLELKTIEPTTGEITFTMRGASKGSEIVVQSTAAKCILSWQFSGPIAPYSSYPCAETPRESGLSKIVADMDLGIENELSLEIRSQNAINMSHLNDQKKRHLFPENMQEPGTPGFHLLMHHNLSVDGHDVKYGMFP